jgi:DNA anti-recombination protein RmuC
VYERVFVDEGSSALGELLGMGVVPAGPGTLFAYIQTIAYGLQGFAFREREQEIIDTIFQLQKDFEELYATLGVAGTHLKNLARSFDDASTRANRVQQRIARLDPMA